MDKAIGDGVRAVAEEVDRGFVGGSTKSTAAGVGPFQAAGVSANRFGLTEWYEIWHENLFFFRVDITVLAPNSVPCT